MAPQPQPEPDAIVRYERPSQAAAQAVGRQLGTCDGCKELTARVERLERLLAQRVEELDARPLGTTPCYWICVGGHALCLGFLYTNETFASFGMMLTIGAVATLAVTHVLSTRPIHERTMRTVLSASIVTLTAMLGLWLGDVAEPMDVVPFLLMLFPPVFASCWLAAKCFVWIGGWRIIPPGYSANYPRIQILHLMLGTLLVAAYLAANRLMIDDMDNWFGEDFITAAVYLCFPAMFSTAISCLLARTILKSRRRPIVLRCIGVAAAAVSCMTLVCTALFVVANGFEFSSDLIPALMLYSLPLTFGALVSSGSVFGVMRSANYRFTRSRDVDKVSELAEPGIQD